MASIVDSLLRSLRPLLTPTTVPAAGVIVTREPDGASVMHLSYAGAPMCGSKSPVCAGFSSSYVTLIALFLDDVPCDQCESLVIQHTKWDIARADAAARREPVEASAVVHHTHCDGTYAPHAHVPHRAAGPWSVPAGPHAQATADAAVIRPVLDELRWKRNGAGFSLVDNSGRTYAHCQHAAIAAAFDHASNRENLDERAAALSTSPPMRTCHHLVYSPEVSCSCGYRPDGATSAPTAIEMVNDHITAAP